MNIICGHDCGEYLNGRCSWILVMRPMLGSELMYIVARIAITTKSHEEGLAGYTPLIKLFCGHRRKKIKQWNKKKKSGTMWPRLKDEKKKKNIRRHQSFDNYLITLRQQIHVNACSEKKVKHTTEHTWSIHHIIKEPVHKKHPTCLSKLSFMCNSKVKAFLCVIMHFWFHFEISSPCY